MPVSTMTISAVIIHGRASRASSETARPVSPSPSNRKSTSRIEPPSKASPSRCTDSITGNSQAEPTTTWPSHNVSHH